MRMTILAGCVVLLVAAPLGAQATSTAPVSGHSDGQMEHPDRSGDTISQGAAAAAKAKPRNARVWTDATRLAALLRDLETEVTISPALWRTIGNEALTLANRIYARTARNRDPRAAATELRTHVRQLRAAARRGDAVAVRRHADAALPSAYRLIEWSGAQ